MGRIIHTEQTHKQITASYERHVGRWLDPCFLLTGVGGVLLFLLSACDMERNGWYAILTGIVLALSLWFIRQKKRTLLMPVCTLLGIFAIGVFLAFRQQLTGGLTAILQCLAGGTQESPGNIVGTLLWLSVVLALVLFLITAVLHFYWLVYVLVTVMFAAEPLFGVNPSFPAALWMCLFQAAYWLRLTLTGKKRKRMRAPAQEGFAGRSTKGVKNVFVLVAAVFVAAVVLVGMKPDWFYNIVYEAEGSLQRTAQRIDGNVNNPVSGVINRGNLYPAGTVQLRLWTGEQPEETLYLRGFSGGDYKDGEWMPQTDEELFERMDEKALHWTRWRSWIPSMFSSLYFSMNRLQLDSQEPHSLTISMEESERGRWYQPYYSVWHGAGEIVSGTGGYYFQYYDVSDISIDWQNISPEYEMSRDWFYEVQEAYLPEAQETYTRINEEEIPRIVRLCEENPMEDLDHITSFILYSLNSRTEYTTTPGLSRLNADPTEYFLFESGQGYCQHYASAATLMYRLYGIPARYVAGYAVSPSDFEKQEEGYYTAVVTDESAHAWTEIYLEDYGWTPVEVTPSGTGVSARYPGFDSSIYDSISEEFGANDGRSAEEDAGTGSDTEETAREESQDISENVKSGSGWLEAAASLIPDNIRARSGWALAVICLFAAAAAALSFYRKKHRSQWLYGSGRRVFAQMIELLHFCGYLKQYDGDESDFPVRMAEIFDVTGREVRSAVEIVSAETFGKDIKISENDFKIVENLYHTVAAESYRKLSWYKQIQMKVHWPDLTGKITKSSF